MLEKSKIEKNPGKRSVAKLKANSQWGFLAMRTNKTQHKFITKPAEWFMMLADNQYVIEMVDFSHENVLQVYYSKRDEFDYGSSNTNVVLAAFVTSQGRLSLYKELEKLDTRVLYMDTDSIFFTCKDGEYEPSLGNYLGEFTNEIDPKEGSHITTFVSAGAKNYAYELDTGKTKCTVKGFTLNNIASLKLNYASIKDLVLNNPANKITVPQLKFDRNKKSWDVTTNIINKLYGFVYDKRILFNDLTTLPFGYSE